MIETKTLGQLIDELTITNLRSWFAQEKIMNTTLSNDERLFAAIDAQKLNIKRNSLIQAIDKKFGESFTVENKTYG